MINNIIYFDNASTTKVDDAVLDIYNQTKKDFFANPSSIHSQGFFASRKLSEAREKIINNLKVGSNKKIIFTSGATEANSLAIKGVAFRYKNRGNHIIISSFEHPSIEENAKQLKQFFGFEFSYLSPKENGKIDINELENLVTDKTILVSIIAVNNETGSINDIEEIANCLKKYPKVIFHTDATQAIGKVNFDYSNVDLLTLSGHKIHGLNSSGALIYHKNIQFMPLLAGGGQEDNYRSGTNDVAMAISLAEAIKIASINQKNNYDHVLKLNNIFRKYLLDNPNYYLLNSPTDASNYIINFSLKTAKASVVVEALSNLGIMVSSTSACHSKKEKGSEIVKRMFNDTKRSENTIRISFDSSNTIDELNKLIDALDTIVKEVKYND